ncbi:type I secretion system permease/ATPase [Desulfovibrio intestinalis]|uniref:ATP-binding cassette subfamily C protein LapB n=1 Tax=Desulfovibrio intestinalis TaxID=58621 RepID=A0A7W8FGR4_9BACT|nr:type I secretion system permease/ATPase [Desulfovibrio intestinalis]MBB5144080.1 ATP-binding cassette subfamily C protein LapB [Desulfovibrio intestinalis]
MRQEQKSASDETPKVLADSIPESADHTPSFAHSLRTLLRLLGRPVSLPLLLSGIRGGPSSDSPSACLRSAKRYGLDACIAHRKSLNNISSLVLPCILLLKHGQSCVLLKQDSAANTAEVIFPEGSENPKSVNRQELEEEYVGYAVFGSLTGKLDARARVALPVTKRWFWDVIAHYMPLYKHVIIATILINFLGIAGSLFAMNVYDRVVPNQAEETLWVLASGVLFAYVVDFILRNVRGYFVDLAGRNADVVLSSKLMSKVLSLRMDAKPDSTGALVNNLSGFESLRDFFSSGSLVVLADLPFLIIFLSLIFLIGGPIVFVPLTAVPLMVGIGLLLQMGARRFAATNYMLNMQKNALLTEIVHGLETVKTSRAESRLLHLWEQICDASAETSRISRRYATLTLSVSSGLSQLVSVGVIVWGVYRIMDGAMTMGGLIACNILAGRAMAPLMQLAGMISRLHQSRMALAALNSIMELPTEDPAETDKTDFGLLQPAFTFEHVGFSYPGAKHNSLSDVSFTIRPHEKVGIIGRMGSGKSTVGRLMTGLYTPQEGAVRFGGVDLRQMDAANLRGRIGYLPQDVTLFYGTIRDNIALDDPGIEDQRVLRAAYQAGATEFIRTLPGGLGAPVGEQGFAISGGQRQSVALARALLHDPEVLILDEPTSNMDKATESLLRTRLAKLVEGKTLVLITHRASLLALVNRLIIIDNGRVVADGPRDEVLEAISSQKSQKHKSSASAKNDRNHAEKADKNTGQTAGEGKKTSVEKLAPTSPTAPPEDSFKGGIRGAA